MSSLLLPWMTLSILIAVGGAISLRLVQSPDKARNVAVLVTGGIFIVAMAATIDFYQLSQANVAEKWGIKIPGLVVLPLSLDRLTALILPFVALLVFLTVLATPRTKLRRVPFSGLLVSEAILFFLYGSRDPWVLITLLSLLSLQAVFELHNRRKPWRNMAGHMLAHVVLLVMGWSLICVSPDYAAGFLQVFEANSSAEPLSSIAGWGLSLLLLGLLIRVGIFPFHTWIGELGEHASLATTLVFLLPMPSIYVLVRLVLPIAPSVVWDISMLAALLTAVYASGMSLVQTQPRRYFCYSFLSHSALVLAGLSTREPISLSGSLAVWLSAGVSLTGVGLSLRSLEARMGQLSLTRFHGLFEQVPILAVMFLVSGLAAVGFPGTIGFVAEELLIEGVIHARLLAGVLLALVAALNSIAVLQVYFRLFGGTQHRTSVMLHAQGAERWVTLILVLLVFGTGLFPQPFISSRFRAADDLLQNESNVESQVNFPNEHGFIEAITEVVKEQSETEFEAESPAKKTVLLTEIKRACFVRAALLESSFRPPAQSAYTRTCSRDEDH
ncbi:MAG: proton-conducting transporter membrane subunit [Pirellulaceae bacterium]